MDRVVPAHNDLFESSTAALAAIDEELSYFRHLREQVALQRQIPSEPTSSSGRARRPWRSDGAST